MPTATARRTKRTRRSRGPARSVVVSDPEILGGAPVFAGTRVPFKNLIDYIAGGEPLEEFLRQFPTVTRRQALAALREARTLIEAGARPPR